MGSGSQKARDPSRPGGLGRHEGRWTAPLAPGLPDRRRYAAPAARAHLDPCAPQCSQHAPHSPEQRHRKGPMTAGPAPECSCDGNTVSTHRHQTSVGNSGTCYHARRARGALWEARTSGLRQEAGRAGGGVRPPPPRGRGRRGGGACGQAERAWSEEGVAEPRCSRRPPRRVFCLAACWLVLGQGLWRPAQLPDDTGAVT